MAFAIEFSAQSARDFELIFDHLLESHVGFGENAGEALERAARRILDCCAAAAMTLHHAELAIINMIYCHVVQLDDALGFLRA